MDTKITGRIEQIGAILVLPEKSRMAQLEGYIQRNLPECWELLELDRTLRSKRENWKGVELQMIRGYQAWLVRYDRAWSIASEIASLPRTEDWDELATQTGLSRETCRQTVQALRRGGWN